MKNLIILAILIYLGRCSKLFQVMHASSNLCKISFLDSRETYDIECGYIIADEQQVLSASGRELKSYEWNRQSIEFVPKVRVLSFPLNIRELGPLAFSGMKPNTLYLIDVKTKSLFLFELETLKLRILARNEILGSCWKMYVDPDEERIHYLIKSGSSTNVKYTSSNLIGENFSPTMRIPSTDVIFGYSLETRLRIYFCKNGKVYRFKANENDELFSVRLGYGCESFVVDNDAFVFTLNSSSIRVSITGDILSNDEKIEALVATVSTIMSVSSGQNTSNACQKSQCAEFCVLVNKNPYCLCSGSFIDSTGCTEVSGNKILISTSDSIYELSMDKKRSLENEIYRVQTGAIEFIVFDYLSNNLFFGQKDTRKNGETLTVFKCDQLDCINSEVFGQVSSGIGEFQVTAYDVVSGLMYFTDNHYNLGVIKLRGNLPFGKILVRSGLSYAWSVENSDLKLRGLAVDPVAGYLFFGDVSQKNLVYRSDLKVNEVNLLDLKQTLDWPNNMVVDPTNKTLYIIDGNRLIVHKCDYFGNTHELLNSQHESGEPTNGLVKFGSIFFISKRYKGSVLMFDSQTRQITTAFDADGPIVSLLLVSEEEKHRSLKLRNGCSDNNGGCSHFCFSTSKSTSINWSNRDEKNEIIFSRTCGCPEGMELSRVNDSQCLSDHRMFLLTNRTSILFFSPTIVDPLQKVPCNFDGLQITGEAAYDIRLQMIFFIANKSHDSSSVYGCNVSQEMPSNSVSLSKGESVRLREPAELVQNLSSKWLAYDWSSRFIFWTDSTSRSVLMSTVDGKHVRVVASGYDAICCLAYFVPYLYFFADRELVQVLVSSDWNKQSDSKVLLDLCGNRDEDEPCQGDRPIEMTVHSSGRKLIFLGISQSNQKFASVYDLDKDKEDNMQEILQNQISLPSYISSNLKALELNGSFMFAFGSKSMNVLTIDEQGFWANYPFKPEDDVKFSLDLSGLDLLSVTNIAKSSQPNLRGECFLSEESFKWTCDQLCFSDDSVLRNLYDDEHPGSCGCFQDSYFDETTRRCVPSEFQVLVLQDRTVFTYDAEHMYKLPFPVASLGVISFGGFELEAELSIVSFAYDPLLHLYFYIINREASDLFSRRILAGDARGKNVSLLAEANEEDGEIFKDIEVDPISRVVVWFSSQRIYVFSLTSWRMLNVFSPVVSDDVLEIKELKIVNGQNTIAALFNLNGYFIGVSYIALIDIFGDVRRTRKFNGRNNPRMLSVEQEEKVIRWTDGMRLIFSYKLTGSQPFEKDLCESESVQSKELFATTVTLVVNHNTVATLQSSKVQTRYIVKSTGFLSPPKNPDAQSLVIKKGRQSMKAAISLSENDKRSAEFCDQLKCTHFCDPISKRCACPFGYVLMSLSSSTCVKIADKFSCPPEQATLRCEELGIHDRERCPEITLCAPFANNSCSSDQQTCMVSNGTTVKDTTRSEADARKVCYRNSASYCEIRPSWCLCDPAFLFKQKTEAISSLASILENPLLVAVIGCLLLVVAFASVVAFAIVLYKYRTSKKSNKTVRFTANQNSYDDAENSDGVSIAKVSNNIDVSKSAMNLNSNQNNLFINTSINVHQTVNQTRTRKKSPNSSDMYSHIHSTSSSHKKHKRYHNHSHVPQNSIRTTSVFSSSCGTLNNAGAPPPTPNPSIYNSDVNYETMCPDCRMRQNVHTPSPGIPTKIKKPSWSSWKRERHSSGHHSQKYSHRSCKGFQSGEESEPLFLPKSQGAAGLPNGSRFADFYPSAGSHNTMPSQMPAGKYVKRRRFIMDELVTYTPGNTRGSHHRSAQGHSTSQQQSYSHGHPMPPPPAPACTPLSGSQEFNSFLPPSPVSDRTSSMVYVVRQVHVGHDPPPSPVSNG